MVSRLQGLAGQRMFIVAAGVLACALLGGGSQAQASTVAGRITGAPIPATGAGEAFVRAVSLQTGEIVAVDGTDAAGRYRMTVPKGAFALFPTVVTLRRVFAPKPATVRLRRGQRKSVRLPARPKAVVLRPIVALPDNSFTGGTGELTGLNRGLRDMLITDLLPVRTASCDLSIVDRSRRAMDVRAAELALVRRGLVDPATAIRAGGLIEPTRGIRGTISLTGGRLRLSAETYRWSSKKTLHRTSVEGAKEEFFELELDLARRLAALLCEQPPPVSGTFSGSLDYGRVVPVGVTPGTLSWSGSLDLEPQTSPAGLPPGLPPQFGGPTTIYQVRAGTLTASLRITSAFGGCTISGTGTFDVPTILGGAPVGAMTITEGDPDTYRLALDGGLARIPTVLSDCPPGEEGSNGRTGEWPLRGIGLLPFTQTPAITAEGVFAGTATGSVPGTDDGYRWTWSLRG